MPSIAPLCSPLCRRNAACERAYTARPRSTARSCSTACSRRRSTRRGKLWSLPMGDLVPLSLTVNGVEVHVECAPADMLADVLRQRLGLTGTKVACGEAECGACTVLVDDLPVLSCSYPAIKAQGKSVETIEGLAPAGS